MGRKRQNPVGSGSEEDGEALIGPIDLSRTAPKHVIQSDNSKVPTPPAVAATRRSLRNQERMASSSKTNFHYVATMDSGRQGRKRNFLKETVLKTSNPEKSSTTESTSSALKRMFNKRVPKGGKGGIAKKVRFLPTTKASGKGSDHSKRKQAKMNAPKMASLPMNPSTSSMGILETSQQVVAQLINPAYLQHPAKSKKGRRPKELVESPAPVSIKMEVVDYSETENVNNSALNINEPKKRGRKRKIDVPPGPGSPVKTEAGSTTQQTPPVHPLQNGLDTGTQGMKRGRQSTATGSVKPRFPFCSLCLSKNPPRDYIINYMSCPNEYQRMRRMFVYFYKDLKFPFLPFDLERENVFDYCDLPLCDYCILMYKDLYDTYAQIETAKDGLKSKVEKMVHQIQSSEMNSNMINQLNSIKSSPDPLMNKYCNFRRRFAMYKPGDSRGNSSGESLVPATIARIRVINPAPKRTTGCQTVLTVPPQVQIKKPETTTESSEAQTLSTASPKAAASAAPNESKMKLDKGNSVPSNNSNETTPVNDGKGQNTTEKSLQSGASKIQQSLTPKGPLPVPSAVPSKPPQTTLPTQITSKNLTPIILSLPSSASKKTTPLVISKVHAPQATATTTTPTKKLLSVPKSQAAAVKDTLAKDVPRIVKIKEEPTDHPNSNQSEEQVDSDPFFASADTQSQGKKGQTEQDGDKASLSGDGDDSSDTNVFRKHKKLRILPVPAYLHRPNNGRKDSNSESGSESPSDVQASTSKTTSVESEEERKVSKPSNQPIDQEASK